MAENTELLTPDEVAKILGVRVQTLAVWRMTKCYPLKHCKIGNRVRYRRADVERYIATTVAK